MLITIQFDTENYTISELETLADIFPFNDGCSQIRDAINERIRVFKEVDDSPSLY